MKQLSRVWKALMKEPDVTAVAILVLVLGIGTGLQAGPEMVFSLTCDTPMMDARAFSLELPELEPLEFSDFDLDMLPEIEIEFGAPETGIGPI